MAVSMGERWGAVCDSHAVCKRDEAVSSSFKRLVLGKAWKTSFEAQTPAASLFSAWRLLWRSSRGVRGGIDAIQYEVWRTRCGMRIAMDNVRLRFKLKDNRLAWKRRLYMTWTNGTTSVLPGGWRSMKEDERPGSNKERGTGKKKARLPLQVKHLCGERRS